MYVQRVTAISIAVTGTGSAAVTTITVPNSATFVAGGIYDILLRTQTPALTDGTIVNITNGAGQAGSIMQRCTANYARSRALGWRQVIRVQYFDDPVHFVLLGVRG